MKTLTNQRQELGKNVRGAIFQGTRRGLAEQGCFSYQVVARQNGYSPLEFVWICVSHNFDVTSAGPAAVHANDHQPSPPMGC